MDFHLNWTNAVFGSQSQEHSLQHIATGRSEVRQLSPSMRTYTELMNCISYTLIIIIVMFCTGFSCSS